ncbi:anthranilate synthase component I [Achromatium sp. WMS1]|nr:anthranilate synthase component I [Achromatium sp. WMS1]
MTPKLFATLTTQGFNRIPVVREIIADLETPLSIYFKLANSPYSYLFESMQGGEKWGRYSIIGLPCHTRIMIHDHNITVEKKDQIEHITTADPLLWIENFQKQFKVAPCENLPRFTGGLVGYFGYDIIRYIEPHLAHTSSNPDPLGNPDILLLLSDEIVVYDNLAGRLYIIVHVDPTDGGTLASGEHRIQQLIADLAQPVTMQLNTSTEIVCETDFVSEFKEADFKAAVERIKKYILEGDCMQVVLSQRLAIPFITPAIDLYRALRVLNPSPYMYYLNLGKRYIVGSSPEILVRQEEEKITVRPIAGTRHRGLNDVEDKSLEMELLADPKEIAEHLMLIDLGRNDIGRVAKTGTVKLTDKMIIERYSHVMHIVSNVCGKLRAGLSNMDVLRATFPAGTVSGAPKIRAMEIIDELEPVKRGIYSGAVGYLGWNGNMDTAIAIRTAIIQNGILYIQVGAGIVADSQPQKEWEETLNKGRAIFKAVAMAVAGINSVQKS